MDGAAFRPTHQAPEVGLPAWDAPDPAQPASHRLDPGLPVEVLEETTGWARVRCSNGWEAWVDGRVLVPFVAGLPTVPADSLGLGGAITTIGIPVAVVLLASFLPWFSAGNEDVTAWDIELAALFTHRGSSLDLKTGPVLLVLSLAALAVLAFVVARPVPRAATIAVGVVGALVFGIGALGVILYLDLPDPRPGLGIGMLLTMAGGTALAAGGFLAPSRAVSSRHVAP